MAKYKESYFFLGNDSMKTSFLVACKLAFMTLGLKDIIFRTIVKLKMIMCSTAEI
jgi:hypothetical protein